MSERERASERKKIMLPKYNESGASMTPIRSTQVLYHHGFEDVQLKVSVAASDGDGHVVPHHLGCHHGHGLALGGVHLACSQCVTERPGPRG